eukprot:TRINITY_DN11187_c0_g1_i1.p1 TRINITY_DN11187_c0_g1~~TRINITY_DN11187_c0_g1_i1.p1  ORF type:complete len:276 (-),score=114.43 TRINITY_DN11187_c0_g1_i1:117-944(-)
MASKQGAGGPYKPRWTREELNAKFAELCTQDVDAQAEFFLKSFIFDLGDDWKEIPRLLKDFRKYVRDGGEGFPDLNVVQAADFLQKNGLERTATQRSEEIRDIDLDQNQRISFVEYLLIHFKLMILQAYYKRTEQPVAEDLSKKGVGITGVGTKLLDELFTMPVGISPELEKAIEEFAATQRAREAKLTELRTKAAAGGVKGLAAANEIKQLESADQTGTNRLELTLNAAKKKAAKGSGDEALAARKKAEEEEAKRKAEESKAKLKAKAALWENK